MFGSVRTTLGLVLLILVLVGLASVGTTLRGIEAQKSDVLFINLMGRQRMLSQKIIKEALLGLQKGDPGYVEEMHTTAHLFEQTLQALMAGGQVFYNRRTVSLPPITDPTIGAQLAKVQTTWEQLHGAAHAILESEPESPAFVQGLEDLEYLSGVILEQVDEAARMQEAAATARVTRLKWIQLTFLATGALTVAIGFWLIQREVISPLSALTAAAGRVGASDLNVRMPAKSRGEIGKLQLVFNKMLQSLEQAHQKQAQVQTQIEQRAERLSREVAEHRDHLNLILASIADGVYTVDRQVQVTSWSRGAEDITGHRAEQVLGRPCEEFLAHTDEQGNPLCGTSACPLKAAMETRRSIPPKAVFGRTADARSYPLVSPRHPSLVQREKSSGQWKSFGISPGRRSSWIGSKRPAGPNQSSWPT